MTGRDAAAWAGALLLLVGVLWMLLEMRARYWPL